ncbi:hypothetical protein JCM10213_006289 [Rhodosporidiobolus nylandii]
MRGSHRQSYREESAPGPFGYATIHEPYIERSRRVPSSPSPSSHHHDRAPEDWFASDTSSIAADRNNLRRGRLAIPTSRRRPAPHILNTSPSADSSDSETSSVAAHRRTPLSPRDSRHDRVRRSDSRPAEADGGRPSALQLERLEEEQAKEKKPRSVSPMARFVFCGLFLLATITSLDNTTVYQYLTYATSSFDDHAALGIVSTAQAVAIAESLLIGIFWSFLISIGLYAAGYAAMAASPSIAVYTAGSVVSALGNAALVSLQSTTIIAYSSSLAKNALRNSYLSVPYYFTGWGALFIVDAVLENLSWRWGVGMLCILTPVCIVPLLVALFIDERRKRKLKSTTNLPPPSPTRSFLHFLPLTFPSTTVKAVKAVQIVKAKGRQAVSEDGHLAKLDAIGLLLLAITLSGLLLPPTLVGQGAFGWTSPVFFIMLGVGVVSLVLLVMHELRAKHKLFPTVVFKKRRTIISLFATFLNMASFFLLLTYQYSCASIFTYLAGAVGLTLDTPLSYPFLSLAFPCLPSSFRRLPGIAVMHPTWSPRLQGVFAFTEQFALTLVHLLVSWPVKWLAESQTAAQAEGRLVGFSLKQPMVWTCVGHGLRVVGVGLMLKARQLDGSIPLLYISQVIHGAGGAIASVFCIQIGMASVPSLDDVALVWALMLLVGDVGNACGAATATLMWQSLLPRRLDAHLGSLVSAEDLIAIFDSTTVATSYDQGSEISHGIKSAYVDTMQYILYVALGIATLSFLSSFGIGDASLADRLPDTPTSVEQPASPVVGEAARRPAEFSQTEQLELGQRRRREKRRRRGRRARADEEGADEEKRLVGEEGETSEPEASGEEEFCRRQ